MTDFSDLAATVAARRAELLEREAHERDPRSGLLALRPAIDLLETSVRPTLEDAKAALLPAGIRLEIEDGWTDTKDKEASLILCAMTAGSWPSNASHVRSFHYTIAASDGVLSLRRHVGVIHGPLPEAIDMPAGADVASEAVRRLVDDVLTAAEEKPVLSGIEVRGSGRIADVGTST